MNRSRKAKWTAPKSAPVTVLTMRDASTLSVVNRRLLHACDLLSCLEYCQDAELNLGALAIAVRDLIDTVRDDLKPLSQAIRKAVRQ